ncbi:hypothetical protein [Thermomonas flagellata]|uniref:hypothetical protein n=1 Tax=Thermomonas flagellata TaxID=2888524 RepID=UPI001F048C20|nr:hypothetical protein [Thermomonas flagellata]
MAWKNVIRYGFGFRPSDRRYWLYYTLEGETVAHQLDLTATHAAALAALFNASSGVQYETGGGYFSTAPRSL